MEKLLFNNDWSYNTFKNFLQSFEEKFRLEEINEKLWNRAYAIVILSFNNAYDFGITYNEYEKYGFSNPFILVDFDSEISINSSYIITNEVYGTLKQVINEIESANDFKEFRKSIIKKYVRYDGWDWSKPSEIRLYESLIVKFTDLYAKARRENINLEMEEVAEGYYNVKIEINIPK